jgi:alpha-N-arabinofuranosidase
MIRIPETPKHRIDRRIYGQFAEHLGRCIYEGIWVGEDSPIPNHARRYGDSRMQKIACGPNAEDYDWTNVLMAEAGSLMDGLSLHYYTLPTGMWDGAKGSAVDFDDREWYETIRRTRTMDTLIARHSEIMDGYDPAKRVGLVVDEWGTWYDVEPGTNPGFLFQQNTIRDAVVAALNFNTFHRHADRVRMANIAQMVNVLQAMVLTDGPAMVRTPTYYAFDLYTDHQDAYFVEAEPEPDHAPGTIGAHAEYTVSRNSDSYTISVTNVDLLEPVNATFELPARITDVFRSQLLAGRHANSHNSFAAPDEVRPVHFPDYQVDGRRLRLTLPPRSIVTVRVGQPSPVRGSQLR